MLKERVLENLFECCESPLSLFVVVFAIRGAYYTPINRLAKTLLIAIIFAMSMSAKLKAQLQITFTASSPPTLTQADVNSQVSGITSQFIAIIADNITTIGNRAFQGGTAGNAINSDFLVGVIALEATNIEENTFSSCSSLTNVSFQNAKTIGQGVFSSCTSLETVSFPAVIEIGRFAFIQCNELVSVALGQNPPSITQTSIIPGISTFDGLTLESKHFNHHG